MVLGRDVLHQLGQVLAQPLGVALVGLGHLLDEGLLCLVNIDYGWLQKTTNLLEIVIQYRCFLIHILYFYRYLFFLIIFYQIFCTKHFSDLGHEVEEHVEARLAGVLAHDVGGRQVEQRGAQLRADRVQQHRLATALHQSERRVVVT